MKRFKMIEFLVTTAKLRVSKKEITYLQYLILSSVRKHYNGDQMPEVRHVSAVEELQVCLVDIFRKCSTTL